MGHKKTELNSVPVCTAMRNQAVKTKLKLEGMPAAEVGGEASE